MRKSSIYALTLMLTGCVKQTATPDAPPTPTPTPGGEAQASAPTTAPTTAYDGHGLASLSPELLEKFRPRPVASEIARKVQALLDVRAPGVGMLTPDGKNLFFGWSISGTPQIWKLTGPRQFAEQITGGEDRTDLVEVTHDGSQLVLQRDRKGEENPGLYLQSTRGGPLTLIQHTPNVQTHFEHLSDDGRSLYFSANDRDPASYVIYRYDLASKERSVAFDAEPGLWHVSDSQRDGRLLLRKETGGLWAEYAEWNPSAKTLTPLFGQNEREDYTARYGARPGELIVLTNKFGEFRRLHRFAAGKFSPLSEELPFDIDEFDLDRAHLRVVYAVNERGYSRLRALDPRTGKPVALPRLPDSDRVRLGPTTPDGRFTTIGIDDGRHPMQGYVLDWRTGALTKWHAPSTPEVDTSTFERAKLESYPARDGAQIPAFVRQSEACARATCPVLVIFHGGPESQARPGFSANAQLFIDAGFVLVEPNVRGSDGYGKSYLAADDGPKRLAVISDVEDAATWARKRFAVSGVAPKVGVYGGSYGGYAVLMAMTKFAGAYDAGVDVVGISDLRTFLRNTAPYRRILRISEYGDPERDAEALAQLSPLTYVDRVRAPLLIQQGANDPRVPAGEAVQLYDALTRRGVPCELAIYADEGHGAAKRDNLAQMIASTLAFLQRHLASAPPPVATAQRK
ncbi:MAG: prolyl oligopeptidase family serine peptidase [Polyangiales bacterium]